MASLRAYLNCDLGEGISNDEEIFPLISFANIACGGHAGDESTMKTALLLSKKHNVKAGCHPSYPDRENFGRISVKIPILELCGSVREQIRSLKKVAKEARISLNHVKFHGALYHEAANNRVLAEALVNVVKLEKIQVVFAPPESVLSELATKAGIIVLHEGFADRTYEDDGSLSSRKIPGSVITDSEKALCQSLEIIQHKKVQARSGNYLSLELQTICVHGDNPNCIEILKVLNK